MRKRRRQKRTNRLRNVDKWAGFAFSALVLITGVGLVSMGVACKLPHRGS